MVVAFIHQKLNHLPTILWGAIRAGAYVLIDYPMAVALRLAIILWQLQTDALVSKPHWSARIETSRPPVGVPATRDDSVEFRDSVTGHD